MIKSRKIGGVERSSNFELMRIILILLIIAHHYVVNSGLTGLYNYTNITANMFYLQLFGMFGKTAINGFTLITGYFMVNKNITLKKFLKIYLEVKFYYLLFYLIFLISGYEPFSVKGLVKTVFNICYEAGEQYVGTYVVFFLFIPYLNLLIKAMSKKQYEYLILLLIIYFTVFSTFMLHETFDFLGWMITMYLIGGYIRLYPCRLFEKSKTAFYGIIISLVLMVGSVAAIDFTGRIMGLESYFFFHDSHKFLAVTFSVSMFLFFKNIKIYNSRIINTAAASTFGILLIHANSNAMRRFLWCDVFNNISVYNSKYIVLHSVLAVLLVYVVCLVIDMIRITVMEKPLFSKLDKTDFFNKFNIDKE
ncbi:MAG: acyltransferase [Lachnospiraceae bacterium]|nr:acyltransferase [Lachnospiraceae bacterium]